MPAPIVIRNLTPETKMGNESPKIATREDLRDGARGDSGGVVGGAGALAYAASDGVSDGQLITLMTDGSEGWDFGSGPSDLAVMGFGQGLLYSGSTGATFQGHTDGFSGALWDWERDARHPSRQIVQDGQIRALKVPDGSGGFLTHTLADNIPENGKLFISTLSKSEYGFVNEFLDSPIPIQSVTDSVITLESPWPYANVTVSSTLQCAADAADSDSGLFAGGGIFTNGSNEVVVTNGSPASSGVQPGWVCGRRALSQWKGVRISDTGGFGSAAASPLPNNYYETPNNSTEGGFIPNTTRWVYMEPSGIYGLPGAMWFKEWIRADHQFSYGALGAADGKVSGNLIAPTEGYAEYNVNENSNLILHGPNRRVRSISWQDFTVGVLNPNLFRTDFFVQAGTFARFELANSPDPATTTEAYLLPPVIADWGANSARVMLWKSLFSNYSDKFIHFYDENGTFRKAVAL